MPVNFNSFEWPSMGIEPPAPEDAIYSAGDQPIAGFDNHVMWAITDDLHRLRDWAASHGHVHEAGGGQEINLNGLSIANTASLTGNDTDEEVAFRDTDGYSFVRYDVGDGVVRAFPAFAVGTTHREGLETQNDITRADGTVLYDHSADYFHRAYEADEADHAVTAGNADMVDGHHADEFLLPSMDASITGQWAFGPTVDADISGNANTADWATNAGHADEADQADLALDSDHLEGNTTQDILDMVDSDLISGALISIEDDGVGKLDEAGTINFGTSADVSTSGDVATVDINEVPFAQEAEWAINSDKVDGYHAQELLDEAEDQIRPKLVDVADDGTEVVANADRIDFGQSMDVSNPATGVATVDVDSVPHAQNAEYAYNADRVDNMHAQEIIDAASSQAGGGQWTYIDDWELGGPNSEVDWEVDMHDQFGNTYDIYKMVIVHENASSYEGWKWFKFNLNFDFRFRYEFSAEARASTSVSTNNVSVQTEAYSSVSVSHSTQIETGWKHWPVCPSKPYERSVAEYKIANPRTMSPNTERKPHISVQNYNGSPYADKNIKHGKMDTDFDDIYAFSLETDHPASAYVQLWGTQLGI